MRNPTIAHFPTGAKKKVPEGYFRISNFDLPVLPGGSAHGKFSIYPTAPLSPSPNRKSKIENRASPPPFSHLRPRPGLITIRLDSYL